MGRVVFLLYPSRQFDVIICILPNQLEVCNKSFSWGGKNAHGLIDLKYLIAWESGNFVHALDGYGKMLSLGAIVKLFAL
ncbi:hypothetical protein TanjilG_03349 [Lupinus angustifolius]|uniref:Uncharacterized protein n=1 Tax=Lupinus angustifolius TaxID=3871 RepID=A0A4P1RDL7_LUPAN|nr:hypothetical protein TanjilG_03349 [Lupinus angustifolius]